MSQAIVLVGMIQSRCAAERFLIYRANRECNNKEKDSLDEKYAHLVVRPGSREVTPRFTFPPQPPPPLANRVQRLYPLCPDAHAASQFVSRKLCSHATVVGLVLIPGPKSGISSFLSPSSKCRCSASEFLGLCTWQAWIESGVSVATTRLYVPPFTLPLGTASPPVSCNFTITATQRPAGTAPGASTEGVASQTVTLDFIPSSPIVIIYQVTQLETLYCPTCCRFDFSASNCTRRQRRNGKTCGSHLRRFGWPAATRRGAARCQPAWIWCFPLLAPSIPTLRSVRRVCRAHLPSFAGTYACACTNAHPDHQAHNLMPMRT